MRYRPEIDGLRGLAVMCVLLYHAHVPGFGGGYVGVDVFFVISGYLITQLIESSAGDFGPRMLGEFYLRRARRLLPALYVLLSVAAIGATILFLPEDLIRFGRGLLLATVFLGNVGAWLDGGYFDPGWRFTPLRHLWSIGVEEQFYLLFPLLLFAIARLPLQARRLLVAGLTLLSFLVSVWAAARWPVQNYYALPTRGWELLTGVCLALRPQVSRGGPHGKLLLSLLALALLALVVWQARFEHFPSIANLAACVSTGVLIATNTGTLTALGRILSLRPAVFTGLISYSLYLWHAPVLAYVSYFGVKERPGTEQVVIVGIIYLVSALSWRFVEQPFRAKSVQEIRFLLPRLALPATLALALFGYWLMRSDGLPQRFAPPLPRASAEHPHRSVAEQHCLSLTNEEISGGELCAFGAADDAAPRIVVWGDSHTEALLPAYQSLAETHGLRIYYGVKGACWPLLGAEAGAAGNYWHERCVKFNQAMAQGIRRLRPQRVILNAYWLDPSIASEPEFLQRLLRRAAAVPQGIERTLSAVGSGGATACAVLTVPGYPYPIPYSIAIANRRHLDVSTLGVSRTEALAQYHVVEDDLRAFAARKRLLLADLKDAICPSAHCLIVTGDGISLYQDANHLSVAGSHLVAHTLESCIADLER